MDALGFSHPQFAVFVPISSWMSKRVVVHTKRESSTGTGTGNPCFAFAQGTDLG